MAVDKEEVGRVVRRSDGRFEAQTALYRRTREQDDIVGYRNAAYDTEEEAIASLAKGRGAVNKDDLDQIKGVAATETAPITSGDLIKFRSDMLRLARESKGEGVEAGFYAKLAKAADDDIGAKNFQNMSKEQIDQLSKQEYAFMRDLSAANAFSKQLNDVFTRAFGGDLVAKTTSGRDRIIPELAAEKLAKEAREKEDRTKNLLKRSWPRRSARERS